MTGSGSVAKGGNGDGRKHSMVNHTAAEYVRYEDGVCISTNTVRDSLPP
jgi:hypothetical protein